MSKGNGRIHIIGAGHVPTVETEESKEFSELALLSSGNPKRKLGLQVGIMPNQSLQDALERLLDAECLVLIDITPLSGAPKGQLNLWRVYRITDAGMYRLAVLKGRQVIARAATEQAAAGVRTLPAEPRVPPPHVPEEPSYSETSSNADSSTCVVCGRNVSVASPPCSIARCPQAGAS